MWAVQNIEDVKSDMSVFHRVDDILTMAAASFFSRVERLGAYKGIVQMRGRIRNAEEDQRNTPSPTAGAPYAAASSRPQHVPADVLLAEHERDGWAERV